MVYKTSKNSHDEWLTPEYAITPILKYLKPNSLIWCPFDSKESNYVKVLEEAGHTVIATHINNELQQDFLNFKHSITKLFWKDNVLKCKKPDYIISNPPFSLKTQVLIKLYELKIPFMILLPIPSLGGIARHKLFQENGLQLLIFDKRINFNGLKRPTFNSSYFCWNVLPEKLIFEKLEVNNEL